MIAPQITQTKQLDPGAVGAGRSPERASAGQGEADFGSVLERSGRARTPGNEGDRAGRAQERAPKDAPDAQGEARDGADRVPDAAGETDEGAVEGAPEESHGTIDPPEDSDAPERGGGTAEEGQADGIEVVDEPEGVEPSRPINDAGAASATIDVRPGAARTQRDAPAAQGVATGRERAAGGSGEARLAPTGGETAGARGDEGEGTASRVERRGVAPNVGDVSAPEAKAQPSRDGEGPERAERASAGAKAHAGGRDADTGGGDGNAEEFARRQDPGGSQGQERIDRGRGAQGVREPVETSAPAKSGAGSESPLRLIPTPVATPLDGATVGARTEGGGVAGRPLGQQGGEANATTDRAFVTGLTRGLGAVLNQKGGSLTMKLTPPTLGDVRIVMTLNAGRVSVEMEAGGARAHELLNANLPALRATLEGRGLTVERIGAHLSTSGTLSPGGAHSGAGTGPGASEHGQGSGRPEDSGAEHDAGGGRSRGRREATDDGRRGGDDPVASFGELFEGVGADGERVRLGVDAVI